MIEKSQIPQGMDVVKHIYGHGEKSQKYITLQQKPAGRFPGNF